MLVCLVMFLVDLHKENTNIELMSVSGKVSAGVPELTCTLNISCWIYVHHAIKKTQPHFQQNFIIPEHQNIRHNESSQQTELHTSSVRIVWVVTPSRSDI
jgi:hypothetical protein